MLTGFATYGTAFFTSICYTTVSIYYGNSTCNARWLLRPTWLQEKVRSAHPTWLREHGNNQLRLHALIRLTAFL